MIVTDDDDVDVELVESTVSVAVVNNDINEEPNDNDEDDEDDEEPEDNDEENEEPDDNDDARDNDEGSMKHCRARSSETLEHVMPGN